jgi:hypothetical protein
VTTLERRCRLLLLVYPAGYRRDRGEEIIGTLLEATPEGRAWPLARDVRGLAMGGLRARAALNRQQTTAVNLRIAIVAGAAAYLVLIGLDEMIFGASELGRVGVVRERAWLMLLAGTLLLAVVAIAWISSRKAVLLAIAVAAAVAAVLPVVIARATGYAALFAWGPLIPRAACLAALWLSGRNARPGRGWLWPVAPIAALLPVAWLAQGLWPLFFIGVIEAMGVISLLWVVIDARPAVAMAVLVMAVWLPIGIASLVAGPDGPDIPAVLPLLIVTVVAPFAVWRLRRQSGRATMRRES